VPSLAYSARGIEDLERLRDFLVQEDAAAAEATIILITEALEVLKKHPLIGRPAEAPLRELVISRGKSGYLALYQLDHEADRVVIRAIRHQREAGFEE
jgi:plasmid stabilization system protein ParE